MIKNHYIYFETQICQLVYLAYFKKANFNIVEHRYRKEKV